MQLLYCDKYVDQGMLGVMHSKPKAGLHPAQSREEVSWGEEGSQLGGVLTHPPQVAKSKSCPQLFLPLQTQNATPTAIPLPPSLARPICPHPPHPALIACSQ